MFHTTLVCFLQKKNVLFSSTDLRVTMKPWQLRRSFDVMMLRACVWCVKWRGPGRRTKDRHQANTYLWGYVVRTWFEQCVRYMDHVRQNVCVRIEKDHISSIISCISLLSIHFAILGKSHFVRTTFSCNVLSFYPPKSCFRILISYLCLVLLHAVSSYKTHSSECMGKTFQAATTIIWELFDHRWLLQNIFFDICQTELPPTSGV